MRNTLFFVLGFLTSFTSLGQISFPPLPPTGLVANQSGLTNSIDLTWTAPASGPIAGYKVYFSSPYDPLDSVTTTSTSINLGGLMYSENYTLYIKSFKVNPPSDTVRSIASSSVTALLVNLVAPTPSANPNLVTHNSFGLSIDDSNPFETGFDIELTDGATTRNLTAGPGSVIFQEVSGLQARTTYGFRVRARRNNLIGPWSNIVYITTKIDFPPAPILTSDVNCPNLIHVKWTIPNRMNDVETYVLKRSFDGVNFDNFSNPSINSVDLYDNVAIAGKTHFYILYTSNSTGSTPSNILAVTAKSFVAPNPPISPISNQTNKSNNHLTIQWTNGAVDLECKTNFRTNNVVMVSINNGEYKPYANLPGYESSVKIANLKPKDIVDVAIFSISDKELVSSQVKIRDTTAGPPYIPTGLVAVLFYDALGNPTFGLNWSDNSKDEDYFIIERSTDNISFVPLGKVKMDVNFFKDLTPDEATIYYYRVKAGGNTEGDSPYTPSIGPFLINPSKAPNAAYGLKAKENAGKVNLTWYDDSKREENYIVEKSLDAGLNYSLVATLGKNVVNYSDENVSAGKTYLYRVVAKNAIGSSANSNIASIKMSGTGISQSPINFSIYPNPAFEVISIKSQDLKSESVYTLTVFDRNNRQVLNKLVSLNGSETLEIPINNLGQGLYNVVLSNGETSITKKIFKY